MDVNLETKENGHDANDSFSDEHQSLDTVDGGFATKFRYFEPAKLYAGRYRIFSPVETFRFISKFEPDSDIWYKVNSYPRGKLVIFNMKEFLPKSGLDRFPRVGTERDVEELTKLFLELGYLVELYDNLNTSELLKVMSEISHDSYDTLSSFFCAILTHGEDKIIYTVDGPIEIRKLTSMFTKSNLAGKPKVFIIQACQGSEYMEGNDVIDGGMGKMKQISIPIEADFLFAYSTARGFYSWRNSQTGSWFIQTLCKVFREKAHHTDLLRMLTKVNAIMGSRTSKTADPKSDGKRQIASTVSQLRKEFYFFSPPLDGS